MYRKLIVALVFTLLATNCLAQSIAVNQQNKTIAITAEAEVSADAEIASVTVGYSNYGETHDVAYKENVRVGNEVSKALEGAGVGKNAIETSSIKVERAEVHNSWTAEQKRTQQFMAEQSWTILVAAKDAQKVVAIAFASGANTLDDVMWFVADPAAQEAKASSAALVKARGIAEQMAQGFGAKLGELVHASNEAPREQFVEQFWRRVPEGVGGGVFRVIPTPTLFPPKVKTKATARAVFAIQ